MVVALVCCSSLLALVAAPVITAQTDSGAPSRQQAAPTAPDDLTRVYYADEMNRAVPLPFETGLSSFDPGLEAESDKLYEVELKGSKSAATLPKMPRFYVFVNEKMDPPPHQLILLRSKKDVRQFTIIAEKGRKGFTPLVNEQIKLDYRVLERFRVQSSKGRILFVNYVELSPAHALAPGEYAIVGNAISYIATFRVE